jgi:hypothetical protein
MKFSTVRFFGFAATSRISSWIFLESASSLSSLPTIPYAGGNIRQMTIAEMWELSDSLRFAVTAQSAICGASVGRATTLMSAALGVHGPPTFCSDDPATTRTVTIGLSNSPGADCENVWKRSLMHPENHLTTVGSISWWRWTADNRSSACRPRCRPTTEAWRDADCTCALPWL